MYRHETPTYGAPESIQTPGEGPLIVRRLAISLAILTTLIAAPATRGASGACSHQTHNPILSAGSVSPATGTTSTLFTFRVTYSDTKGCAPLWVRVAVAGVGTFLMNGSGTTYDTGVAFTYARTLPPGSHAYSFSASSGIGSGQKTTTLTAVAPPSVTVTSPTPPPTPPPTPRPTAMPTPVPTPLPTPPPTTAPTPVPTPAASGTPATSPTGGPSSPPGSVASQGQLPGGSSSPGPNPGSLGWRGGMGSMPLLVGAWATATAGGLALFLYLAPRRRRQRQPAFAGAEAGASLSSSHASPARERQSDLPPDEAKLPRWLRPSVQAARHDDER